jgi:DnaJ-class molecular chaperone
VARRTATADPAPKCGHCNGWGCEPDANPLTSCTVCGGTGRPTIKKQEPVLSLSKEELIDE